MPIPSPFFERTHKLCTSMAWKDWGGYYAVCHFESGSDREYYAFRHSAGLIDVTPLFKYDVRGKDAARFLAAVTVKDITKLKRNQVTYLCWTDQEGKLIDDGTVTHMGEDWYRLTAAEPSFAWFQQFTRGFDVTIEDMSEKVAALALQGPYSRDILKACSDAPMDKLRFFRMKRCKLDGMDAIITRTGYTGDLGYEIWVDRENALKLWDALMDAGKAFNIQPAGLDTLDIVRIEAGFLMNGVDYHSAHHCLIEDRMSTPYEAGLGWTVQLERDPFIGQAALQAEMARGPAWGFVGLEIDWPAYEALCAKYGLPPQVCGAAWRDSIPVYDRNNTWVGYGSSGTWSPILKKNLALATLQAPQTKIGTELLFEMTVEHRRHTVPARVVETPFFNPARKRSLV